MKRFLLPLILLTALPALGQFTRGNFQYDPQAESSSGRTFVFDNGSLSGQTVPDSSDQACQVTVLQASFERPARKMLTAEANSKPTLSATPSLQLQLENRSDKPILFVDLNARLKVKETIYQLDSITRDFPLRMTLTGGSQRLKLGESAFGFDSLSIRQVTYADGTSWSPENSHSCVYHNKGGSLLVAK